MAKAALPSRRHQTHGTPVGLGLCLVQMLERHAQQEALLRASETHGPCALTKTRTAHRVPVAENKISKDLTKTAASDNQDI